MEEFLLSSWTVLLLPPKRVNKRVQLSFIPGGMLFLLTVLRKMNVCDSHCKCYKNSPRSFVVNGVFNVQHHCLKGHDFSYWEFYLIYFHDLIFVCY